MSSCEHCGTPGGAVPVYCPACGAALQGGDSAVGIYSPRTGDGGYDTYCSDCGWSGDIFPDSEQGEPAPEKGKASFDPEAAQRLREISRRAAEATHPEWRLGNYRGFQEDYDIETSEGGSLDGLMRGMFGRRADAEFAAHARSDIPWLLEEVSRLGERAGESAVDRSSEREEEPEVDTRGSTRRTGPERAAAIREKFARWDAEDRENPPEPLPPYDPPPRRRMEVDLRQLDEKLQDMEYAREVYAALAGNAWVREGDSGEVYECTARYAGALVAFLRARAEDYGDFFVDFGSPLKHGEITGRVRTDLKALGWSPVDDKQ